VIGSRQHLSPTTNHLTPVGVAVESQGPLAILWVGIGLCCFYIALIWLNSLLGFFLTPLFIIPATWLMDWKKRRDERSGEKTRA
jgi:hypothetical protein